MLDLFNQKIGISNAVIHPPGFDLVKRTYQKNIYNIIEYFQNRIYAVNSNHFLCRLINTANIPYEYDLFRFAQVASVRSPYIAKYFNMTSSINYGKIHNGIFYGEKSKEILIFNDDYFNPQEAIKNWKNLQAIKVIDHNISNLSLLLPDGGYNNSEEGISVIEINISLLLVQFRGFAEEQNFKNSEEKLSLQHFIHMYVLPNMLYTHVDIALLNRMINLYYKAPMGESLKHYPFHVIDYSSKIDNIFKDLIKYTEDKRLHYYTILKLIPSIFKEDMQESLLVPDMAMTKQVQWSIVLSRLRVIEFLISLGGAEGLVTNMKYINHFKADLKRTYLDNILYSLLDKDTAYDILASIKIINQL